MIFPAFASILQVMSPDEIKRLRQDYGISLVEMAAWTGLPSSLIEQIEEKKAVALDGDLSRIVETLNRLVRDRESRR